MRLFNKVLPWLVVFVIAGSSHAEVIDTIGATYPIAERDAYEELLAQVASADWSRIITEEKVEEILNNYRPATGLPDLRRAVEDRIFTVDLTYTVERDILDDKGGILYPKGFTFNPLDYVTLPRTYVALNGSDPEQIEWFENSEYHKNINTMLMISGGSYYELSEKLGRPVYYVPIVLANTFKLQAAPSVIRQKGNVVEVTEIRIEKNEKSVD